MKKILLVSCDGLGNGGVQAVMMGIVRALHGEYQFDILLFTSEERHYDKEFLSYGGRIYRVPRYEGKNQLRKKLDYYIRGKRVHDSVKKILKRNGPYDVVHCHDEFENAPVLKAAYEVGVPIRIAHTHIINQKNNFLANLLENNRRKNIERYATSKIGCSQEACDAYYKVPSESIVINNAYEEKRFDKNKYHTEKSNKLVLTQIGSYTPTKNQTFSVKVVKELVSRGNDVELNLVGFEIGDYVNTIKRTVSECQLENYVKLLPGDSDTPKLLSQSSYLLMPSVKEGFGIVLIEAQAMGLTCFASDAIPQTTNCGGVYYLNLSEGVGMWADRIEADYKHTHGIHRDYDVSIFSSRRIMDQYRNLYEENRI